MTTGQAWTELGFSEDPDGRLVAWLNVMDAESVVPIACVVVKVKPGESTEGKPYHVQIPRVVDRQELAEVLEHAARQLRG
jgi:hypothetical protein